ncbi:MAG TPA: hypothetical protein ENJ28_02395 [Gammaproteobacteria bacterium]|nr:hypothetical protein [Gammaproteobacteria bacterium]
MKKMTWLLRLVGVIQIVLGVFYLFMPEFTLSSMGHSTPESDIFYPLAMLASRFIAYGIALIFIASDPVRNKLWIIFMALIQLIDLAAGIFYTMNGAVPLELSGFPMFNAVWITLLLLIWLPKEKRV